MSDQLFDGRPIRILTVVNIHTRKALSTAPRANFRAAQVVEVLDQLVRVRGKPGSLWVVYNGPEFAGRLLDHWAYLNKVEIDFSRPGAPTDNAFIGAFNVRLRAECLNAPWFLSLADARERIEEWRYHYNTEAHTRVWTGSLRSLCNPPQAGAYGERTLLMNEGTSGAGSDWPASRAATADMASSAAIGPITAARHCASVHTASEWLSVPRAQAPGGQSPRRRQPRRRQVQSGPCRAAHHKGFPTGQPVTVGEFW